MIHIDSMQELKSFEEMIFSAEWEYDPQIDITVECGNYIFRYISEPHYGKYRIITL